MYGNGVDHHHPAGGCVERNRYGNSRHRFWRERRNGHSVCFWRNFNLQLQLGTVGRNLCYGHWPGCGFVYGDGYGCQRLHHNSVCNGKSTVVFECVGGIANECFLQRRQQRRGNHQRERWRDPVQLQLGTVGRYFCNGDGLVCGYLHGYGDGQRQRKHHGDGYDYGAYGTRC